MNADFISGQIDVLRTAIAAMAIHAGKPTQFREEFRQLSQHMQDDMLSRDVSDDQLEGIAAERLALLGLLSPVGS